MTTPLNLGDGSFEYVENATQRRRIQVADTHVTGILTPGLVLSRESATTLAYTAGTGMYCDHADAESSQLVSFTAASAIPLAITTAHAKIIVSLTSAGVVQQRLIESFIPDHYRTEVILGRVDLDGSGQILTDGVYPFSPQSRSFAATFLDYLFSTGEFFRIESGLLLFPNGVNVKLDLSAGVVFGVGINLATNINDPNRAPFDEVKPLIFNTVTQDGTVIATDVQDVPTDQYDDLGTLTNITNGRYGYQLFFLDSAQIVWMSYGQSDDARSLQEIISFFDSLVQLHTFPPQYDGFSRMLGAVLFQEGTTNFTDTATVDIKTRLYFSGVGGVSGGGGQGTVTRVSDRLPDANGNVQLDQFQDRTDPAKIQRHDISAVTAPRTITWPDAGGTAVLEAHTQTLTQKTIDASSNTITNIGPSSIAPNYALWDESAGNVHRATGRVGVKTTTPAEDLEVDGVINARKVLIDGTTAGPAVDIKAAITDEGFAQNFSPSMVITTPNAFVQNMRIVPAFTLNANANDVFNQNVNMFVGGASNVTRTYLNWGRLTMASDFTGQISTHYDFYAANEVKQGGSTGVIFNAHGFYCDDHSVANNNFAFYSRGSTNRVIFNGPVGLGTDNPEGQLHVKTGEASAALPGTGADELVLESAGASGMTIVGADASPQSIIISTPAAAIGSVVSYTATTQKLEIDARAGGQVDLKVANVAVMSVSPAFVNVIGVVRVPDDTLVQLGAGTRGIRYNSTSGNVEIVKGGVVVASW
jgi:hypothetical protein